MPGVSGLYLTRASEKTWVHVPDGWRADQSRRGVIVCHGAGQSAANGAGAGPIAALSGMVCAFPDLTGTPGGLSAWGNDSSLAQITAHWNVLKSEFGVRTDRVILTGISMGTATALMYALQNPNSVAALELELPAVNVDDIRDNNRLAQQANIDTAYGGNPAWETAKTTRDPILNTASFAGSKVPIQIHFGGADPVCLPQFVRQFAAAVPQTELVSLGDAAGHDLTNINAEIRDRFLRRYAR